MESAQGEFVIEEVRGRPQYSIKNDVIGVTMRMLPVATIGESGLVVRKDQIEITFVNHKNPNGEVEGEWFDWPYLITSEDLGSDVDFSDKDYIQEVLNKYKTKFLELKGMPPESLDNVARYKSFIGRIFPDIEQKRKEEGRVG